MVCFFFLFLHLSEENCTAANLPEFLGTRPAFVQLKSPWCTHCKKMAPDWFALEADSEVAERASLYEINCEADKKLCAWFPGSGTPRVFFVDGDDVVEYHGDRTFQNMKQFIQKQTEPLLVHIQSEAQLPEITHPVFLFRVATEEGAELARKTAIQYRTYNCSFYQIRHAGTDILSAHEPGNLQVNLENLLTDGVHVLDSFINAYAFPINGPLTQAFVQHCKKHRMRVLVMIGTNMPKADLIGYSYRTPIATTTCRETSWVCNFVGREETYAVIDLSSERFWRYDFVYEPETFQRWYNRVLANELPPGSAKDPAENLMVLYLNAKRKGLPGLIVFYLVPTGMLLIAVYIGVDLYRTFYPKEMPIHPKSS